MIDIEKLQFEEKINYKLYIKLFDQKCDIPIFTDINKFVSNDEVEINMSKIFYFFTTENTNLKQILKNEEVDFRIVMNDDWNNPIAQCQTTCLSFFDPETATVRVKNTLNFFSNHMKYFKCQVYIGLNNDKNILAENLPFYSYKLTNTIFLTDQDYYSHHPLPDDWYELFIPPESQVEDEYIYDLDQVLDNLVKELEIKVTKKKK